MSLRFSFLVLFAARFILFTAADITVIPGGFNLPKPFSGGNPISSAEEMFLRGASDEFAPTLSEQTPFEPRVLSSSHSDLNASQGVHASSDSFVRGAIEAWGQHQHLVVRPEEVWFTILVQMNYYMLAHGDDPEIRNVFVNHQGKEHIHLDGISRDETLSSFRFAIQERVKTAWLLDWITPNFTMTTESDLMTANVLMMGLMQSYFTYSFGIVCGLPSVTLLGTQGDWEMLLARLDRFKEFGKEPTDYGNRLRPVLTRFVSSFTDPNSDSTRGFWSQIVHAKPGNPGVCGSSGVPYFISGWITAFHYWDATGKRYFREQGDLTIDDITFPSVPINDLPVGYAKAPILFDDLGEGYALAGMLGKKITKGAPDGYAVGLKQNDLVLPKDITESDHNSLQPLSAWMVYIDARNTTRGESGSEELANLTSSIGMFPILGICDHLRW